MSAPVNSPQRPPAIAPQTSKSAILAKLGTLTPGAAPWVLALAVLATVMGAAVGMKGVLANYSWFPQATMVVIITLFFPALLRRRSGLAPFAPLGAVAGWLMALTFVFFSETSVLGFIPTPATATAALDLANEASIAIMSSTTPAPAVPSLVFLVAAGLGFAAVLVDTLAITVALPAAGALGSILIMLPSALITAHGISTFAFVTAASGYLLLLGCCRWYAPDGKLRAAATAAPSGTLARGAIMGAAVVLIMALLPVFIPGFNQGAFPQGARLGQQGAAARIDPMISLGKDLREQSSKVALKYLTSSPNGLYLRLNTLEDFTGKSWQPSPFPTGLSPELSVLAPTPAPNPSLPQRTTLTEFTDVFVSSHWLPTVLTPIKVSGLDGRWLWNPSTATIRSERSSTAKQKYSVVSSMPQLTQSLLQSAAAPPSEELDPLYTELPNDVPEQLRETAFEVAGSATTPYEKAVALQEYLRSAAFTYSLDTPAEEGYDGSGMAVLDDFLTTKSGYCVHFSAAMAVMARELGVPSRIAVGYAPGSTTLEVVTRDGLTLNGFQVAGKDAHAWPELYFEGVGWVPFEPTPSRGQVPEYSVEDQAPVNNNPDAPLPNQPAATTAAPSETASTSAAAGPGSSASVAQSRWLEVTGVLALLLLILLIPAAVRAMVRRRRLARVRHGAAGPGGAAAPGVIAWREVLATAVDCGYTVDPALTPALQAQALAPLAGSDAAADLALVRSGYENAVYSGGHDVSGRDDLANAVESLNAQLLGRTAPWRGVRARFLPASLFTSRR